MEGLQLKSRQQPGLVAIDNFLEMKDALAQVLTRYENVVYTEDMLADAKADKKELTRLRKEIDERRKEIKKAYLAPYNDFEAQVKELLAMVDAPLNEIKEFVSEMDQRGKDAKRSEIWAYYSKQADSLGELAQAVFDSPAFLDSKWLNPDQDMAGGSEPENLRRRPKSAQHQSHRRSAHRRTAGQVSGTAGSGRCPALPSNPRCCKPSVRSL